MTEFKTANTDKEQEFMDVVSSLTEQEKTFLLIEMKIVVFLNSKGLEKVGDIYMNITTYLLKSYRNIKHILKRITD